jgi:hypothetical protein
MSIVIPNCTENLKGTPTEFRNLTIFPLIDESAKEPDYLTLDEALALELAKIMEVSEGGSVPELKFINSGDKKVFLLDGEELVGARQNRILNLSIMVPASKTIVVPVSCVEAGRWGYRGKEFASASRTMYAGGRARKMSHVTQNMKASGRKESNQGDVWNGIREKFARFESSSPTAAMSDLYEQQEQPLEDYVRSFSPLPGQIGAVFALDGKVIGMELFDSPITFGKLFPKLLRSYGLDALSARPGGEGTSAPATSREEVAEFLGLVADARVSTFAGVGLGSDLRLEAEGLTGAALEVDEQLIHLSAFGVSKLHNDWQDAERRPNG